jgi:hypothetical protein
VTLRGDHTVISADSNVEATSSVTISGLENEIGSRLVTPESVFLNADDLLRENCAARRSGVASSFTAAGQGGLPPDPAGPLAAPYHGHEDGGRTSGPAMLSGAVPPSYDPAVPVAATDCAAAPGS